MFKKLISLFRKKEPEPKEQLKVQPQAIIPPGVMREMLREKFRAKKGTLEDLIRFSDETRKTLRIMEGTIQKAVETFNTQKELFEILRRALIDLHVEYGNLKDKTKKYVGKVDHEPKAHHTAKGGKLVGD